MKTFIISCGIFFLAAGASASPIGPVLARCQNQAGNQHLLFSQRLSSDLGLIEFNDDISGYYQRLPATVAYTNAGARAIFSYTLGGPRALILIGEPGHSSITFGSQVFNCTTNF